MKNLHCSKSRVLLPFKAVSALLFLLLVVASAQAAGKPGAVPATEAEISLVDGLAVDKQGNIYIAMHDHNIVNRVDKKGMMTRVAGSGESGFDGDGGPAAEAKLKMPAGLALDADGNLYIADRENHRVRRVDGKGRITTVAGTGTAGFSGDGGPAVEASLNLPSGLVFDSRGNLYIADRSNDRVRRVNTKGVIETFAGNGGDGYHGDAGPATEAELSKPFGIAFDDKDNLYIADRGNNRVRKVSPKGVITTLAGDGGFFFMGDNGPAYRASVAGPTGVAADSEGNVYIADRNNNRIRVVDSQGMIRTVVGTGQQGYNGDSELARDTNLHLPFGVSLDNEGRLLIIDRSHYRIRRVDLAQGKVETAAGNGVKQFAGDGGPATGAKLNFPHGMLVDKHGNLIFSDKAHFRIRKITPDGVIQTIGGSGDRGNIGDEGPVLEASLYSVTMLAENSKGEIYFLSPSGFVSLIRKITPDGIVHHFLDTGEEKYQKAILASKVGLSMKSDIVPITNFADLVIDQNDNLYITDRLNHQIRKVDPEGNIVTIAGTGDSDYLGDGGPASEAAFRDPQALAMDPAGNLYVADAANNRIRKIDTQGIITTIAGNGNHEDTGDGGPALEAGIRSMDFLQVSPAGELHIVESNTHRIRKIAKDGTISTVAGRGVQGYFGDDGPADKAMLKNPAAVAFDSKGNMFISDLGNNRIRKVDAKGIITTYAGSGTYGWASDGETVEIYFQNFP